jgi:hypothetical protein
MMPRLSSTKVRWSLNKSDDARARRRHALGVFAGDTTPIHPVVNRVGDMPKRLSRNANITESECEYYRS